MKLMIVFGTRPEVIKLSPVIELARRDPFVQLTICSTGQHRQMLDQALAVLNIEPDIDLDVMVQNQTLSSLTAALTTQLAKCFADHKPDIVMVQGDTTTAFVASLMAFYAKIPVAHVEAGLRTGNLNSPFPEEFNRISIARIATWHFAPTARAKTNLALEGVDLNSIHVVGNTVVDALNALAGNQEKIEGLKKTASIVPKRNFVLVTAHRRENHGDGIHSLCQAIKQLAAEYINLDFIFPVHLNPNVRQAVNAQMQGHPQILLIDPVDFSTMLYLEAKAIVIITDSGGIQEEAASLCNTVVVMRDHTERAEGIEQGFAILAGISTEDIVRATKCYLNHPDIKGDLVNKTNPYGDGLAAIRILDVLNERIIGEFAG
jgi:UDP-N-acetylglucosamine 2-epimerase (non-hydrolysing)